MTESTDDTEKKELASFTSRKLDFINAMLVDPRLRPADFCVGVAVLQFMNSRTGMIFPSIETIAEIVHMSPRYVRQCLNNLRTARWLSWKRGNRQLANEYAFDPTNLNAMLDYRTSIDDARRERKMLRRSHRPDRNHSSPQKRLTGTIEPLASGTIEPLASGTPVPPNTCRGTPAGEHLNVAAGAEVAALDIEASPLRSALPKSAEASNGREAVADEDLDTWQQVSGGIDPSFLVGR